MCVGCGVWISRVARCLCLLIVFVVWCVLGVGCCLWLVVSCSVVLIVRCLSFVVWRLAFCVFGVWSSVFVVLFVGCCLLVLVVCRYVLFVDG